MKPKSTVLLILIDGFRHDYLNQDDSPFLNSLCKHNIHGIVKETFAFELRPAFFAGLQPEECNIAHMFCYDPVNSPFRSIDISHGNREKISSDLRSEAKRRGYSVVQYIGGCAEIPLHMVTNFDFSEKYNTCDPNSIPGHETLFDNLRKHNKKWLWVGYPSDHGTTQGILSAFQSRLEGDEDFIYLHFSELDWIGHEFGPHSPEQRKVLSEIDNAVCEVYGKLNKTFSAIKGIIFGDHGQVAIKEHIDLEQIIQASGLRVGTDFLYFLDSTQARFWFFNEHARDVIVNLMERVKVGRLLSGSDLERLHFSFSHNKFGDLIFVVNDGIGIFPNFFQHQNPCKGLHGYLPEVEGNWAKLIITGLGYREKIETPVEMVNLYPTMLEMLGIDPHESTNKTSVLKKHRNTSFKASVIMPTFNRLNTLKRSLAALEQQKYPIDAFELIVVNDGSNDGTTEFLFDYQKRTKLNLKYIEQVNAGPAAARNVGVLEAQGEIIIFIGDDIIVSPQFITEHLNFHEELASCCHVCLGHIDWADNIEITPFMRHITSEEGGQQFRFPLNDADDISWGYFWTSNISLKRVFFTSYASFNSEVFKHAMLEDVELGYRLSSCGMNLHYRKNILAFHEHTISIIGFIERQRMVGWYCHDLISLGVPISSVLKFSDDTQTRIYSRKILNSLVEGLSTIEHDINELGTHSLSFIYNYILLYAKLTGYYERIGETREEIGAGLGVLLNLYSGNENSQSEMSVNNDPIINVLTKFYNKLIGYKFK